MNVLQYKEVVAKKQHKCDFCIQPIKKGEKYRYAFIVDSGDSWPWKSHLSCDNLVKELGLYKDCTDEGVTEDLFQEVVIDKYQELTNSTSDETPCFDECLKYVKNIFNNK